MRQVRTPALAGVWSYGSMKLSPPDTVEIDRGLDITIGGRPLQRIDGEKEVRHSALVGRDYTGVKPVFLVEQGDRVTVGQPLFADKRNPALHFTAPAAGRVLAVNRGARRTFVSLVIEIDGDDAVTFPSFDPTVLPNLPRSQVYEILLHSGLWSSFRTRPFSMIPDPGSVPAGIFVTAIDTDPLPVDPWPIIDARRDEFSAGLTLLRCLTDGPVFLCHPPTTSITTIEGITSTAFSGPHPAGLPGSHIHFLMPVDSQRTVWHVGFQDLIAIGSLFLTGRIDTSRIVALGGPRVRMPRLVRTRLGADLGELTDGELLPGPSRIISGSVLSGYSAAEATFLGRYHTRAAVLPDEGGQVFLGWLTKLFGRLMPQPAVSTLTHGSPRALVPIGAYENVMPLDLKITWLLRSLLSGDQDMALKLGCLELDEEDLALCSYVCPSKIDYGGYLRQMIENIRSEGI